NASGAVVVGCSQNGWMKADWALQDDMESVEENNCSIYKIYYDGGNTYTFEINTKSLLKDGYLGKGDSLYEDELSSSNLSNDYALVAAQSFNENTEKSWDILGFELLDGAGNQIVTDGEPADVETMETVVENSEFELPAEDPSEDDSSEVEGPTEDSVIIYEGDPVPLGNWGEPTQALVDSIPGAKAGDKITVEYTVDASSPQLQIATKQGDAMTWTPLIFGDYQYIELSGNEVDTAKLDADAAEELANAKEIWFKGANATITKIYYTPSTGEDSSSEVDSSSKVESSSVAESSSEAESSEPVDPNAKYSFEVKASNGGQAGFAKVGDTEETLVPTPDEGTRVAKAPIDCTLLDASWVGNGETLVKRIIKGGAQDGAIYTDNSGNEAIASIRSISITITGAKGEDGKYTDAHTTGSIVYSVNGGWDQAVWKVNVSGDNDKGISVQKVGTDYVITRTFDETDEDDKAILDQAKALDEKDSSFAIAFQNYGDSDKKTGPGYVIKNVVAKDGNGEIVYSDGEVEDNTYAAGTKFKCTATPNEGYVFTNWIDADGNEVSTDAEFEYELPAANTVLTANFKDTGKTDTSTTDTSTTDSSTTGNNTNSGTNSAANSGTNSTANGGTANNGTTGGTTTGGTTGGSSTTGSNDASTNTGASALALVGLALAGVAVVLTKKNK
ncbi:MAG: hypothetical protein ACI4RN_03045, partial [Oscillospiraceae bacterium]